MAKIFSLPNYTSILVEGVDSEKLLQGQISCDLALDQNYFNGLFCDDIEEVLDSQSYLQHLLKLPTNFL